MRWQLASAAVIGRAVTIEQRLSQRRSAISGRCASLSLAYTARAEHHTFINLLYSKRPKVS